MAFLRSWFYLIALLCAVSAGFESFAKEGFSTVTAESPDIVLKSMDAIVLVSSSSDSIGSGVFFQSKETSDKRILYFFVSTHQIPSRCLSAFRGTRTQCALMSVRSGEHFDRTKGVFLMSQGALEFGNVFLEATEQNPEISVISVEQSLGAQPSFLPIGFSKGCGAEAVSILAVGYPRLYERSSWATKIPDDTNIVRLRYSEGIVLSEGAEIFTSADAVRGNSGGALIDETGLRGIITRVDANKTDWTRAGFPYVGNNSESKAHAIGVSCSRLKIIAAKFH